MPCYINIEDRYNVRSLNLRHQYNVFGATATALAIGAGVIGVAGAVTTGIMGSQAAGKAAKDQAQAAGQYQNKRQKALAKFEEEQEKLQKEIRAINPNINVPPVDIKNLQGATTEAIEAANRVTSNTISELRRIDPNQAGAVETAYQNLAQAQSLASQFLTQGAPEESRQAVLRQAAERGGAGFNIAAAGRGAGLQATQANYARMLGQQDIDFRRMGAQMAQELGNTAFNWRNTSALFLQPVPQMMSLGTGIAGLQLTQRAQDVGIQQQNIANQFGQLSAIGNIGTQLYGARTGTAKDIYGSRIETIQTELARGLAQSEAIGGMFNATAGALSGLGSVKQGQEYIGALNNLAASRA